MDRSKTTEEFCNGCFQYGSPAMIILEHQKCLCYKLSLLKQNRSTIVKKKEFQQNNNKGWNDIIYFKVTMCQMLTIYNILFFFVEGTAFTVINLPKL